MPKACERCAPSRATSLSRVTSGNAAMISGQALRGKQLRCLHALTVPGRWPTFAANAEGPPFSSMMLEAEFCMDRPLPSVTSDHNRKVTHGNVTGCNAVAMAAQREWHELREPWERLRWAREQWQQRAGAVAGQANHAAESLGMKAGTYRAYERGPGTSKHIELDHQHAIQFARRFRVSWVWLLTGAGAPSDDEMPESQERVLKAMSAVPEDKQRAVADMVEALLRTGT